MERELQIPLHNPGQIILLTEECSMEYRINKLRLFNIIRFSVLILAIICYFFDGSVEKPMPFNGDNSTKLFLTIVVFYIFMLVVHTFFLFQKPVAEWLIFSNAFWDMVFVLLLILFFNIKDNSMLLGMIVICSVLLSSLTFSMKQSLLFSLLIGFFWVLASSLIKILPLVSWPLLEPMTSWQRFAGIGRAFVDHRDLLIEPILIAFGIALISGLIGFFAAQGRDNRISAEFNRRYTAQLRKLNDSIIEDMQNGLLVVSGDGIIMTLNREARRIFGLAEDAPVPYKIEDLSLEISQRMWNWNGMVTKTDLTLDINKQKYSLNFSPLNAHKDMALTLVMLEDINQTLRRVQENRLSTMGRLTAGIAHEIRNPLGSVQSAADLLEEMTGSPKVHFLTSKIRNNARRISAIINDILNLFSNNPCSTRLIPINSFLRSIVSEARINDETSSAIIHAEVDKTTGFAVFFDPGYLRQILHNLMLNAVKHAGRKDICITIRTATSPTGRLLYIDVLDNGIGVSPEDEERIFEPFFSKHQYGTGLGLYLVREMCVANQTQINYIRQDQGACFRLSMERYLLDSQQVES